MTTPAPRALIVVATGQAVANLPPILAYGRPGADRIVWLQSAQAKQGKFADSSVEVLKARGFREHHALDVGDHPGEMADSLRAWLNLNPDPRPILVGNGGTKLGGMGLADALANRDHGIIYGDGQPCRLWIKESGAAAWTWRSYNNDAALGLPEILTLSGNVIDNPRVARRFWPDPAAWGTDPFGEEFDSTVAAHDAFDAYDAAKRAMGKLPPRYREASVLAPVEMARWRDAVIGLGRQIRNRLNARQGLDGLDFDQAFNVAAGLARQAESRAELLAVRPAESIGPRFEKAVARRARAWLDSHCALPVVEAWETVVVRKSAPPGATKPDGFIELDVTLVLTNGVLLNLECKTFEIDARDMTARLLNLQTAGSRLATMHVCAPVYTACADRPWFQKIEALRRALSGTNLKFIGFTLPGQPHAWSDPAGRTRACPSFEAALDRLIAPYCPSPPVSAATAASAG